MEFLVCLRVRLEVQVVEILSFTTSLVRRRMFNIGFRTSWTEELGLHSSSDTTWYVLTTLGVCHVSVCRSLKDLAEFCNMFDQCLQIQSMLRLRCHSTHKTYPLTSLPLMRCPSWLVGTWTFRLLHLQAAACKMHSTTLFLMRQLLGLESEYFQVTNSKLHQSHLMVM